MCASVANVTGNLVDKEISFSVQIHVCGVDECSMCTEVILVKEGCHCIPEMVMQQSPGDALGVVALGRVILA